MDVRPLNSLSGFNKSTVRTWSKLFCMYKRSECRTLVHCILREYCSNVSEHKSVELLIDIGVTLVSHAYINLSLQWDLAPIPIDSNE